MKIALFECYLYLIQDAVTNTVVPCFNVDILPEDGDYELIEDRNCICLQGIDVSQPKTVAIANFYHLSECEYILKKDSLFDRYIITDFEFEPRADGSLTPYPVCPKCGARRFS